MHEKLIFFRRHDAGQICIVRDAGFVGLIPAHSDGVVFEAVIAD